MNVINDNWIFVRYLNDEVKQISVRQAFIDADKIKNIETPTFHNVKVYIYDVPVIQLLVTILLAAYFKPENNFAAHDKYFSSKLMIEGWDQQLILDYLDKWQDRFNLFDDSYPFLQNKSLKDKLENQNNDESLGYISKTNLVAPGGNNLIFEHNSNIKTELEQYKPTNDELVYILLYLKTMASSPMAKYYPNKALCGNTTMFLINYGKNLKETLIYNCLPLRDNSYDDDLFDRPIWELDNEKEILNYNIEDLSKNTLLCTFFPCLPIYIDYDNELKNIILSRSTDDVVLNKEARDSLSNAYVLSNPWAIRKYVEENDNIVYSYKEWNKSIKLINLCIEITKHTTKGCGCNLIDSDYQENKNANSVIYYREYDGMKSNVLSFGKYEVSQEILDKLQNEEYNNKALLFKNNLDKIQKKFNEFINSGLTKNDLDNSKLKFSKLAENYFFTTFINEITEDTVIHNSVSYLIKEAKLIVKQLDKLTSNPLAYAISYRKFCGGLNKIEEEIYGTTQ